MLRHHVGEARRTAEDAAARVLQQRLYVLRAKKVVHSERLLKRTVTETKTTGQDTKKPLAVLEADILYFRPSGYLRLRIRHAVPSKFNCK